MQDRRARIDPRMPRPEAKRRTATQTSRSCAFTPVCSSVMRRHVTRCMLTGCTDGYRRSIPIARPIDSSAGSRIEQMVRIVRALSGSNCRNRPEKPMAWRRSPGRQAAGFDAATRGAARKASCSQVSSFSFVVVGANTGLEDVLGHAQCSVALHQRRLSTQSANKSSIDGMDTRCFSRRNVDRIGPRRVKFAGVWRRSSAFFHADDTFRRVTSRACRSGMAGCPQRCRRPAESITPVFAG